MAPIPPQIPLKFSSDNHKLDFDSVRALVTIINQHINAVLEDDESSKALKLKCTSKLKIRAQEFFEFSEHSVLSNLYWGIESIEAAAGAKDKAWRLENSERMLQVPASLDENGVTLGMENSFLVCCAYFYLSVVEGIRKNEWQVAMHFLQALLVSPRLVYTEFAPGICQDLFPLFIRQKISKPFGSRRVSPVTFQELDDEMIDEMIRWISRIYKPWLMYYHIMSRGDFAQGSGGCDLSSADDQSRYTTVNKTRSIESQVSCEFRDGQTYQSKELIQVKKMHIQENVNNSENDNETVASPENSCSTEAVAISNMKCLKDMLAESHSNSPVSMHSPNNSNDGEIFQEDCEEEQDSLSSLQTGVLNRDEEKIEVLNQYGSVSWNLSAPRSKSKKESILSTLQASTHQMHTGLSEIKVTECFSRSFSTSFCDIDVSALSSRKMEPLDENLDSNEKLQTHQYIGSFALKNYQLSRTLHRKSYSRMKKSSSCRTDLPNCRYPLLDENIHIEQIGILEKIITKMCFTEELVNGGEDYIFEVNKIYKILSNKSELKYSILKDMILDQLLAAFSSSKEDRVVRTSLAILSTIAATNRTAIEEIKNKGLQLYDLATALKRNVHEAVVLIYLISPSPAEIKTLELLPFLVELVCTFSKSYKVELTSFLLTPPAASLMIIEILVSAFDYETNSMHLAAISSPRVLSGLLQVPRKDNTEEMISLASILVRCMRFDGKCRKYVSEFSSVDPFVALLWSNQKRSTNAALEFFNELLRIPRSQSISLLEQIQKKGSINNMCALFLLTQNSEPEHKLLAANLLLQLEVLEGTSTKSMYREEAVEALFESLSREEMPVTQALCSFILANLGGTYSWMGEPYTMAWMVKKTGLTLPQHRNLIKNYDFSDPMLQDVGVDAWCSKTAQRIVHIGSPVFQALEKGLKSKLKRVSRDCLTAIAWLGCELVKGPDELRNSACEIILHAVEQYVHPGLDLEERLLACLCIYNYTSGRGMNRIITLSEAVRESLRRLSNTTWMAEELLKVADYFQPNKWRISCVHSQILEAGDRSSGAVTALIYHKGQLCGGYADGSIKVWDIKGQTATLLHVIKEHKKAVTCFSLYEPGDCLLSGSADRTIKMWQMHQRNLECIEVIPTKDLVKYIDSWGELIFAITKSHKLKTIEASRKCNDLFKNKRVKCIRVTTHGKVYAGCTDSSIQEMMITNNRHQEIKAPSKSWIQSKPICSISVYKDWLYCSSLVVEGSKMKDWRRSIRPQISVVPDKGGSILAMEVVEDFIYLQCSKSMSSLQIWLRGTHHKVGRLSAGSKITSLLSANDMIICGTETGVIKGWIPL
ncbi:putative E3 ubiquitin-protein ligase LIN [Primulina eburnea]|uniref:putative E3 ubiquitin-protein ligase LIN n=1 Tax=Primulina eburnea TaxID=1245227 RepID=UPI003C6C3924